MPFLDLAEGVAAIFEEASGLGERLDDTELSIERGIRFDAQTASKKSGRAAERERQKRAAQAMRLLRPVFIVVPANREEVTCPRCGKPGERREGSERVHHRGRWGCDSMM